MRKYLVAAITFSGLLCSGISCKKKSDQDVRIVIDSPRKIKTDAPFMFTVAVQTGASSEGTPTYRTLRSMKLFTLPASLDFTFSSDEFDQLRRSRRDISLDLGEYGKTMKIASNSEIEHEGTLHLQLIEEWKPPFWTDGKFVYYGVTKLDADRATFEVYKQMFGKDKTTVFYGATNLKADPVTFEDIPGSDDFYKDKSNVFYLDQKIEGADTTTFKVIEGNLARDQKQVYDRWLPLKGSDPATVSKLSRSNPIPEEAGLVFYVKDKSSVFYGSMKLEGADPQTIQLIEADHKNRSIRSLVAKDQKHVYVMGGILNPPADPNTFQVLYEYAEGEGFSKIISKDKNRYYENNQGTTSPPAGFDM